MSEEATQPAKEKPKAIPARERSIVDIISDLSKPVHDRFLSSRKQGGKDITYLAWHHAQMYLDHFAAGWSKEITQMTSIAGKVVVVVRITIPAKDGEVSREATGCEDENKDSYGDAFSCAESMALRRAAANFGLGRYLYEK